jgi:hypothetical protein
MQMQPILTRLASHRANQSQSSQARGRRASGKNRVPITDYPALPPKAREIEKRGDFAGAWESAEKAFRNFPDDTS